METEILKLLSQAENGLSYDELETAIECDSGELREGLHNLIADTKIFRREQRKEKSVENVTKYFVEEAHRITD